MCVEEGRKSKSLERENGRMVIHPWWDSSVPEGLRDGRSNELRGGMSRLRKEGE